MSKTLFPLVPLSLQNLTEEQRKEQVALVEALEAKLRERIRELKRQLEEQTAKLKIMRQQLREREADVNSKVIEREGMIRELMSRAERGEDVTKVLQTMRSRLREQEQQLEETRNASSLLNRKLDAAIDLHDATKAAYDRTVEQLNVLLIQKESITGEVRSQLDAKRRECERAQHDLEQALARIKSLEHDVAERSMYVEQLEGDLATHQTLLTRAQEEAAKDASALRQKAATVEAELMELRHTSERERATAQLTTKEQGGELERIRATLKEKESTLDTLVRAVGDIFFPLFFI